LWRIPRQRNERTPKAFGKRGALSYEPNHGNRLAKGCSARRNLINVVLNSQMKTVPKPRDGDTKKLHKLLAQSEAQLAKIRKAMARFSPKAKSRRRAK
jgi:hypothetical protein